MFLIYVPNGIQIGSKCFIWRLNQRQTMHDLSASISCYALVVFMIGHMKLSLPKGQDIAQAGFHFKYS